MKQRCYTYYLMLLVPTFLNIKISEKGSPQKRQQKEVSILFVQHNYKL